MKDRKILSDILDKATHLIIGERADQHGDFIENHENIAKLWSSYLGVPITAHDVALMMSLLKIARTKTGAHNPDDYIDAINYIAIAAGIIGNDDFQAR